MEKEKFTQFKKTYLKRFIKYYIECTNNTQRKELKRSVYDNKNLSTVQKDEFWTEIIKRALIMKNKEEIW